MLSQNLTFLRERKPRASVPNAGNDELRAALVIAGKEIRKLNFGKRDTPVPQLLRRVLREARAVAKAEDDAKLTLRETWPAGERAEDFGCSSPGPQNTEGAFT